MLGDGTGSGTGDWTGNPGSGDFGSSYQPQYQPSYEPSNLYSAEANLDQAQEQGTLTNMQASTQAAMLAQSVAVQHQQCQQAIQQSQVDMADDNINAATDTAISGLAV